MSPPTQTKGRTRGVDRDSLASVAADGSHVRLHPADTRGRFTLWRRIAAVLLIAIYVGLPWIPVNGQPAVFLDLAHLRVHLFGLTLAAQDLWLAFFFITGVGFSLFFVTALFGRLWCGWACPQTVFLEHIYRRIERLIDGDAPSRRQLDRAPWATPKVVRRVIKHALFILVSLLITHVLLAYFVSLPQLFEMVTHSPFDHWGVFLFIVVSTGLLYGNFAWFREQLCIIICPYGRLQSALIDDDSLSIGYDASRGEPRSRRRHDQPADAGQGDCIDCLRCVQVCPTGIDIRHGLQLECIGCANCIDACDEIMDRVGRPRGLVRYDSLNGLSGMKTRWIRPRIVIYSLLLGVGAVAATLSVSRYQPANMSAIRMVGAPYFVDQQFVRNQFMVRVINKQTEPVTFTVRVQGESLPDGIAWAGWEGGVEVGPSVEEVRPLIITVPRGSWNGKFSAVVHVEGQPGAVVLERKIEIVGPSPRLLRAREKPAP